MPHCGSAMRTVLQNDKNDENEYDASKQLKVNTQGWSSSAMCNKIYTKEHYPQLYLSVLYATEPAP